MRAEPRACALTVAGLDPSGGAGIAADLRAFRAAGAFGCAVAAVLTVQSVEALRSSHSVSAAWVEAGMRDVLRLQRVGAVKTGALGSAANVRGVARVLAEHPAVPLVLDPVMLPSRGKSPLLQRRAVSVLRDVLLPRAWLVTANVAEAEALVGRRVANLADAREAARALCGLGAEAALVKGGHLTGKSAVDVLAVGNVVHELALPRLTIGRFHGGGCILASLIAGRRATHPAASMLDTVRWAKRSHHAALARSVDVGGRVRVLDP